MTKKIYYDEGEIILTYILGARPSKKIIMRYSDAISKSMDNPEVLRFNYLLIKFPRLLCIIDPLFKPKDKLMKSFQNRLNVALVVADTSTEATRLFYNMEGDNKIKLIFRLLFKLIIELLIIPLRLIQIKFLIKYEQS
ncbi:MAG: hypothetical protein CML28_02860 [Rhizobiales bacterium]|nr:hypothetical protein [Hyphomicrobiales bacterium]